MEEFCLSLRIGGRVPREVCSDAELRRIFATVDSDKSGAVDAAEFCGWLRRTLALARCVTTLLWKCSHIDSFAQERKRFRTGDHKSLV